MVETGNKNSFVSPLRWGSHSRLNLIGALAWGKTKRMPHFNLAEEGVNSTHVTAFIDELPVTLPEIKGPS